MNITAITVDKVWKKYKIYQDKPTTLKERFLYRSKGVYQEKWVLEDVSLKIEKGKMVGLIGRNGSGKSTLLKILTKILQPDKGEIYIEGKVSSLLELGAGFHMDFTGRENIYMNASIFGLTRKEINLIIDEIIQFSELEAYIDNPVRTYSSGMYMRLAFSIAVHVDPDVLLIDEILAVGDNAFQKKCISRIERFKSLGKTIVFVSHDNGTMERLCDEVYWIHESRVRDHGNPRDVIRNYLDFLTQTEENRMRTESQEKEEQSSKVAEVPEKSLDGTRWGDKSLEITGVKLKDTTGQERFIHEKGKPLLIELNYRMNKETIDRPVFGIGVFKTDGYCCYGTNTYIDRTKVLLNKSGTVKVIVESLNLVPGEYYLDVACHHEDGTPYDYIKKIVTFSVHSYEEDIGVAYLPHKWTFEGDE